MQFDPVLIAPRLEAMTTAGYWRNQTINDFVAQALRDCPNRTAVVAYRSDRTAPERISYIELEQRVLRIARSFTAMGVGHSDVVSFHGVTFAARARARAAAALNFTCSSANSTGFSRPASHATQARR